MSIRDEQVELTRQVIIDTVVDLSASPNGAKITVAEVARRSGVSPATIYRHFPTRDDLVAAAANDRNMIGLPETATSLGLDELRDHLRVLWTELSANMPLTRQAAVSDAGLELRRARLATIRHYYDNAISAAGLDPSSPDGKRFLTTMLVLSSAHTFLDMHDRLRLSPTEAADTAIWAIEQVAHALGIDPSTISAPTGNPSSEAETEK